MRLSQFHLHTTKETPADAELVSHQLMLRAGMIRKLASGLYTWSPLGLRVLRKVEAVVREEMNRAGAVEVLFPTIQPRELWDATGRWSKFGGLMLRMQDRKEQDYCYSPTAEEAAADFARQELNSYKQLPVNFYQIQTKFRDEIRPRFGVMRAREFLMKDAYSFHLSDEDLAREYENMKAAYIRIFTRLGLQFRAVQADSGDIGGDASQEFHVLAESGEDSLAFSTGSDYAANVEAAVAAAPAPRAAASEELRKVATPTQKTCEAVAELLGIPLQRTVKSVAVMAGERFVLALVRGDHTVNEIKLGKVAGLAGYRMANEAEILAHLGSEPGFLGPLGPRQPIRVVADRDVAALADFVVGANERGFHLAGVNWGRDLPEPDAVADLRNVVEGERAHDGGEIRLARGIEVGHVFQLGRQYAQALDATVVDEHGKTVTLAMGCYGIGISRIVAAAIEQNHDDAGIRWPQPMAPWTVAVCVINPKRDPAVDAAGEALLAELQQAGLDAVLDDRGLRPGAMFADIELIGVPHRVVVSERGLAAGTFEYRARSGGDAEHLDRAALLARLQG
ncbi:MULTISPECIES: proline--tRNA ligase [Xanthomonas]|uniref:Proline--tRNA ligase n=1 Tax=Xanthomonas rydalmerensis TaxID=3046274 RepID=A0ABZ0JKG5_9XANT|nr:MULTISPECIES: proline--tRNA ligase [unclassified Xanthomonas]MBB5877131.1 prolyl-tRNA synthetase [Xanthomonas sp. 3498]MXV08200.1 proline--tRNA ligase [Xanthomonas sp. LMG 9002]WOS40281.1 proline--tRNA ligase [Xanthomonas sp. DM-2023]WOS44465.1 proline--tRNA ligase [Xanthomonas sp. DM-2023]WOS48645.1 proline--tRNA ligase [Xanthomonas sp. DM-2023]